MPEFRARDYGPPNRRVYPVAVHQQQEFADSSDEVKKIESDTATYNCFRCGTAMFRKDIFGTFDTHPVCKQCFLDLERAENEGTLDNDYVNEPSIDEEKVVEQVANSEPPAETPTESSGGSLGGFFGTATKKAVKQEEESEDEKDSGLGGGGIFD